MTSLSYILFVLFPLLRILEPISLLSRASHISEVAVRFEAITPDWMWSDTRTILSLEGNFTMPPGYRILYSSVTFSRADHVEVVVEASSSSDTSIIIDVGSMQNIGVYDVFLLVTAGTFTGDNIFQVSTRKEKSFTSSPRTGNIVNVSVHTGPPRGGTLVLFGFETSSVSALDCAFGDLRSPLSVISTEYLGGILRVSGSCVSPMMGYDQFVCVELVPPNTKYLKLAPCDEPGSSFAFSYYDQMPFPTLLVPNFGLSTGGTPVLVSGHNFPLGGDSVACKFGETLVVPASSVNETQVLCSGSPPFSSASLVAVVGVSISFNNEVDWTYITVPFTYVPVASIGSIFPSMGVLSGNTLLKVNVSYEENVILSPISGPKGLCFFFPTTVQTTPTLVSDEHANFTFLSFRTPPPNQLGPVNVSVQQEDGSCGPNPVLFTYVPDWGGSGLAPPVITGGEQAVLVSGHNFLPFASSACLAVPAAVPSGACAVKGSLTVNSSSSSVCLLDLDSVFYEECGLAAETGVNLQISVAMNGVDFVAVTPALVKAVRFPVIEALNPRAGFDAGGYIVEVSLQTGSVSWYITTCIFSSLDNLVVREVPAAPYSLKTVACTVPQWYIGAGSRSSVKIALRVNPTTVSPPFTFTFFKSASVLSVTPFEVTAGSSILLSISGAGFVQDELFSFYCVFGKTSLVQAVIVSQILLQCMSPPTLAGGSSVPLDVSVRWAERQTELVLHQAILTVLHPITVSTNSPLFGPTVGGSHLVFTIGINALAATPGLVRCVFGRIIITPIWLSESVFSCYSPPVRSPGTLPLSVSLDTQTKQPVGAFLYYLPESVASVLPAAGLAEGGTQVLVRGAHFMNSSEIACKFRSTISPVIKFVTPQLVICPSPPGAVGLVDVAVANNGVDFNAVLPHAFSYEPAPGLLVMHPFLGPVSGGTLVSVASDSNSSTLPPYSVKACVFGNFTVPAAKAGGSIYCTTPAVSEPVSVSVEIVFEGQLSVFTNMQFVFYNSPVISAIAPPLGPQGVPYTVTITGENFLDSEYLTVRFGAKSVGFIDVPGVWVSASEIRANTPPYSPSGPTISRLPVMVSNNGQDFVPKSLTNLWNPDDDTFQNTSAVKYYTFQIPTLLKSVDPPFADLHGGGFVSVHGGPFLMSETAACGFDQVFSTTVSPIFISSTHILCPLPNMWESSGLNLKSKVKLQIAFYPDQWTQSYLNFTFLTSASPGSYTPHLTANVFSAVTVPCPPGFMCESAGLFQPMQCPPGTYQPDPGQLQCRPCPRGYFCPQARQATGSIKLCSGGWICDEENLVIPYKRCPAGFICLEGTATSDPVSDISRAPLKCRQGMYCLAGTAALVSVPGNFSTPQPCYQTAYCKPASSSPYGAGSIPLGRYSPTPIHPGKLCPPRYFCGPYTGNVEPRPCSPGTYNSLYGQHNCTLAYEGSLAPSSMMLNPVPSDCGYFAGRKGINALTQYDLCPPAMVCEFGTATDSDTPVCYTVNNASECDSGTMNFYESNSAAIHTTRLNAAAPNCCWKSSLVLPLIERATNIVASMGQRLEVLALARFRQTVQAMNSTLYAADPKGNGFDGLVLLEQVTRASLPTVFKVHIAKVRERILLEIERSFSFPAPKPCAAGQFCNKGTCSLLPPIMTVTLER